MLKKLVRSTPRRSATSRPPSFADDPLLRGLPRAVGREVVGDRVIVRVLTDVDVTACGAPAAALAASRHYCGRVSSEFANFETQGLALRVLRPGERTIGYTSAVCKLIDSPESDAIDAAFERSCKRLKATAKRLSK